MKLALVGCASLVLGLTLFGLPALAARNGPQSGALDSSPQAATERVRSGLVGCTDRIHDRLFFGLGTADGSVSESEWRRFLNHIVTPRFPGGLTVIEATGQWRAEGERKVTVERSRIIEIAHDDTADVDRRINEIVAAYKQQHQQRSVMMTRERVEVCW